MTVWQEDQRSAETPPVILIGAAGSLEAARALLLAIRTERVLSFTDADVQAAVEAIVDTRPSAVALERGFAGSARGGALVNRIRLDPDLRDTAILVVRAGDEAAGAVTLPPQAILPSAGATTPLLAPLDYRGTRQTGRTAFDLGVLVKVDGDAATVVDMSHQGAQILMVQPLRPDQRVRVWSEQPPAAFRCQAKVVWVQYELHAGSGGYYRAGFRFVEADPAQIDAFCAERAAAAVA